MSAKNGVSGKNGADEAQRMALGLIPLLKEYTEKIHKFEAEITTFRENPQETKGAGKSQVQRNQRAFDTLQFSFLRMKLALTQLAQHASQLVEHGKIDPITKLELALRNAEFEAALNEAQTAITAGPDG